MLVNSTTKQTTYRGVTHDKRTKRWRAVRDLAALLEAQTGSDLTAAQRAKIARAAELSVLAAEARRAALGSFSADILNAAVRIENAAERALKGINALSKSKPASHDLRAYLAKREAL